MSKSVKFNWGGEMSKVFLLWEDYLEDRILWSVFDSKKKLEEAVEVWKRMHGIETENLWYEECELNFVSGTRN
jgi:hypothetical protein